ncbi:uncharacterized protein FOMMEDRAFT_49936, partial [Fomitiporia mediterranea MF3/22]|uniref:uncharacterized protein n=1 Tax=Fomitiporia mediterranea (strain MF3/22) TaxID=694068 RepID=UPI0004408E8F
FMIRDEYKKLDEFVTEKAPKYVLVIGQPGIGSKTVYLTYCLLSRLTEKKQTILMLNPSKCYLFQDEGVYKFPRDLYDRTDNHEIIQQPLETLILYDCNASHST